MNILGKILKDSLTETDSQTYDFAKVSGMFGLQCLLAMELWHLYDDNVFNAQEFSIAFSTILASSCAGVYMKNKGEVKG